MGTHTSTGEWQSFEVRMRYRRAERLLLRAEAAAEAGFFEEARAAIDEARQLAPRLAGIAESEARVEAAAARTVEEPEAPSRRLLYAGVAAAVAIVITGAALAGAWWLRARPAAGVAPAAPAEAAPPAATPASSPAPTSPLRVETTSVNPTVVARDQISIVSKSEDRDLTPKPESADAPRPDAVSSPSAAVSPRSEAVAARGQISIVSKWEDRDLTPTALPGAPVATTGTEPVPPPVADTPRTIPPLATPPVTPPAINETSQVRATLDRFASAYSRLDVDAATGAWPRVNRGALSRAFDGLESQQVSLGTCDVAVRGVTARAACHGTTTWRPKIGGGVHTDPRTWTFDLAKAGTDWQIVNARVQNR